MAPWCLIHARAADVSSPPENAIPTRSPFGRDSRMLLIVASILPACSCRSDDHRLGLQYDAELLRHARLHLGCQVQDLAAGRAAPVHQYQRLAIVDRRAAPARAFHPARLDQPPGGQLEAPAGQRVADQRRKMADQLGALLPGDDRVLEEAARVARSEE